MLNGSEATCPDRSPWMRRPSPSLGVGPSGDIDVASWGGRIVELASVEDALRVHHSARPSPDKAPCELTRLTSRQSLILRGLRCCGHRPARRRPGSLESPVTCHDLARGRTDSPRYVHLVLDPRRHPGLRTSLSRKRLSRALVADHLRGARRRGMSSRTHTLADRFQPRWAS